MSEQKLGPIHHSLWDYENYQYTLGRRLFLWRKLKVLLDQAPNDDLHAIVQRGLELDTATWEKKQRYLSHKRGDQAIYLLPLNLAADNELAAFITVLEGWQRIGNEDAIAILKAFFPDGLGALTRLPYAEQSEECAQRIQGLERDHQEAIGRLHLELFVDKVKAANQALQEGLLTIQNEPVRYQEIKLANKHGEEIRAQYFFTLLSLFPSQSEEDIAQRTRYFAPIAEQNTAIRQSFKRRQGNQEIDPDTGEAVE